MFGDAVRLEDHLVATRLEVGRIATRRAPCAAARPPHRAPSSSPRRPSAARPLPSAVGVRAIPFDRRPFPRPVSAWPAVLANVTCTAVGRAVARCLEPAAGGDERRTRAARSSGVASAVASSQWSTSGAAVGVVQTRPLRVGGRRQAASSAPSTSRRARRVRRPVERDRADVPVEATRSSEWLSSSATFWWMKLVANRVSADTPVRTFTSASATPRRARTSSRTRPSSRVGSRRSALVRRSATPSSASHPDPDPAEPGRDRRMAGVADLLRLALAAVRRPPEDPLVAAAKHVHRAPEARADRRYTSGSSAAGVFLPPLISQPTSHPNWKLSRLSSIDHDRFVSM